MQFDMPAGIEAADAQRIARLLLCDHCAPPPIEGATGPLRESDLEEPVRLPYSDN